MVSCGLRKMMQNFHNNNAEGQGTAGSTSRYSLYRWRLSGTKTMEESVGLLKKNLGRMLAYGYGGWWFDMWGGWFSDPRLLDIIKSGQYFYKYPDKHIPAMDPQVAVWLTKRLGFMDASFGSLTGKICTIICAWQNGSTIRFI